jgi:RNA recognition motif-containing protein
MMQALPRKQTVLFVGDLSSVCTEQHIRELFEVNGFNVVDIKMMGGKVTSNSFDYGFVELSSPEEAELALSTLDGTFLCGRRMRVKWAAPNVKNKPSKGIINSVHVRFQSLQVCRACFKFLKFVWFPSFLP